jgi:Spy/CpxP family protein refolding chaperone
MKRWIISGLILAFIGMDVYAQIQPQKPSTDESRTSESQIQALGQELQRMQDSGYGDKHPRVVQLRTQIAKLKLASASLSSGASVTGDASPLTALQSAVKGTFWRDVNWISVLDLSTDQQRRMDDIFQQFRLKLIDDNAALSKEEVMIEPLWRDDLSSSSEAKLLAQIDRIAEARAQLEKTNSRMLVSLLKVMTPEQRAKLPSGPSKSSVIKATK